MAPTEQIIWEAKQKSGSLKGSRRTFTVIDASGCKITRGFLLPSDSSSQSSSASSHGSDLPGIPASPLEVASPGFFRPSGSLYHAPEMAILRSDSDSSLHKPSEIGAFLRPPQLGGRSQTFHGRRASCWYDADSDSNLRPTPARGANSSDHPLKLQTPMRRTKSDHTGIISMQAAAIVKIDALLADTARQSCAINDAPEEEDAIASDSDDEEFGEGFSSKCGLPQVSGIAAQRSRPTYAQRRAMSDQRVVRQGFLPALPFVQPVIRVTDAMVSTAIRYDPSIQEREIETPVEVKSFTLEEIVPYHELRPSRSRPQPTKGVLKNAGSRSSSEDSAKHVHTVIGRGSGSVVNGRVVLDATSQLE